MSLFSSIWKNKKLGLVLVPVALSAALLAWVFNPLRTLSSLQKQDKALYVMTYAGDYGFDEFLRTGVREEPSAGLLSEKKSGWACTCFVTANLQFGRNFDWENDPALLLFTAPPGGYASVSMVDISYLGYKTSGDIPWLERARLLDAPYYPFDGMNEYGLSVGLMAVPHAEGGNDPQKITLDSLQAIRLMLDHARTVDEAVKLLEGYNIDFDGGPPVHYLLADFAGRSAVVEFLDNQIKVVRSDQPWQVSTNFILSGLAPEQALSSCGRYKKVYQTINQAQGVLSAEGSMDLLKAVSQNNTLWSVTYGLESGEIRLASSRNYQQVFRYQLNMKNAK
jgi:choloylglycine hydrolase